MQSPMQIQRLSSGPTTTLNAKYATIINPHYEPGWNNAHREGTHPRRLGKWAHKWLLHVLSVLMNIWYFWNSQYISTTFYPSGIQAWARPSLNHSSSSAIASNVLLCQRVWFVGSHTFHLHLCPLCCFSFYQPPRHTLHSHLSKVFNDGVKNYFLKLTL